MTSRDLAADLALASRLADAADAVSMSYFRSPKLAVERKADRSEVTVADRGTEDVIVSLLAAERPGDAVFGEERGAQGGSNGWRWILDPIDGTANYVRGVPVWATLIALEGDARMQLGFVSAPAMGRRWWAARGLGAYADGHRMSVSTVPTLDQAFMSYSDTPSWEAKGMRNPANGIDVLRDGVGRQRAYGDFWQHMLVAEGAIDLATEAVVALYDLAALLVIVEEAGGRFTDTTGVNTAGGGSSLSSNGLVHDAALDLLRGR